MGVLIGSVNIIEHVPRWYNIINFVDYTGSPCGVETDQTKTLFICEGLVDLAFNTYEAVQNTFVLMEAR